MRARAIARRAENGAGNFSRSSPYSSIFDDVARPGQRTTRNQLVHLDGDAGRTAAVLFLLKIFEPPDQGCLDRTSPKSEVRAAAVNDLAARLKRTPQTIRRHLRKYGRRRLLSSS